jgi:hypothetical protein
MPSRMSGPSLSEAADRPSPGADEHVMSPHLGLGAGRLCDLEPSVTKGPGRPYDTSTPATPPSFRRGYECASTGGLAGASGLSEAAGARHLAGDEGLYRLRNVSDQAVVVAESAPRSRSRAQHHRFGGCLYPRSPA